MLFAFLVSFFAFAHINVGGDVYLSEILLLLYLVISRNKRLLFLERFPRTVLILGGGWLLSQIFTDAVVSTPAADFIRGWSGIVFFLVDFSALYIMFRKHSSVLGTLIVGFALGGITSAILFPSDFTEIEPWKFGVGLPITMLVLLYLSKPTRYQTYSGLAILCALGFLGVLLNARSLGGMTILTAIIIFISLKLGSGTASGFRPTSKTGILVSIGLLFSVVGLLSLYQWAAESGYLPDKVMQKYEMQRADALGLLGLIVGGRVEILISSQAVMDSPLIGHGSWPKDDKYTSMYLLLADLLGREDDGGRFEMASEMNSLIPTHSAVMQAWVWSGLLGAVFWFYLLGFLVRNVYTSLLHPYALQPLVVFTGFASIWDLLFSPFGSNMRIKWVLAILIVLAGKMMLNSRNIKTQQVEQ